MVLEHNYNNVTHLGRCALVKLTAAYRRLLSSLVNTAGRYTHSLSARNRARYSAHSGHAPFWSGCEDAGPRPALCSLCDNFWEEYEVLSDPDCQPPTQLVEVVEFAEGRYLLRFPTVTVGETTTNFNH